MCVCLCGHIKCVWVFVVLENDVGSSGVRVCKLPNMIFGNERRSLLLIAELTIHPL